MLKALDTEDMDWEKLSAVVALADVHTASNITCLAEHLSDFAFIPDAKSEEDVGHYLVDLPFFTVTISDMKYEKAPCLSTACDAAGHKGCHHLKTRGFSFHFIALIICSPYIRCGFYNKCWGAEQPHPNIFIKL